MPALHMYGLLPQVTLKTFQNERTGKLSIVRTHKIFTKMNTLLDESTFLKNSSGKIHHPSSTSSSPPALPHGLSPTSSQPALLRQYSLRPITWSSLSLKASLTPRRRQTAKLRATGPLVKVPKMIPVYSRRPCDQCSVLCARCRVSCKPSLPTSSCPGHGGATGATTRGAEATKWQAIPRPSTPTTEAPSPRPVQARATGAKTTQWPAPLPPRPEQREPRPGEQRLQHFISLSTYVPVNSLVNLLVNL